MPNRASAAKDTIVRFMMLLKADTLTETGALPSRDDLEVMGRYNEELAKAGVLRDAAGLKPSSLAGRLIGAASTAAQLARI